MEGFREGERYCKLRAREHGVHWIMRPSTIILMITFLLVAALIVAAVYVAATN